MHVVTHATLQFWCKSLESSFGCIAQWPRSLSQSCRLLCFVVSLADSKGLFCWRKTPARFAFYLGRFGWQQGLCPASASGIRLSWTGSLTFCKLLFESCNDHSRAMLSSLQLCAVNNLMEAENNY